MQKKTGRFAPSLIGFVRSILHIRAGKPQVPSSLEDNELLRVMFDSLAVMNVNIAVEALSVSSVMVSETGRGAAGCRIPEGTVGIARQGLSAHSWLPLPTAK